MCDSGAEVTVVAADGLYVHPVSVDEFRIAVAETFDVIVGPPGRTHSPSLPKTPVAPATSAARSLCAKDYARPFRLWIPGRC